MVHEVLMPRLSDTMEEGTISRWLKHVGDHIEKGDVLAEVETDKANMDCLSFVAGTLTKIVAEEGQTVKIGDVIAIVADETAEETSLPTTQAPSTVSREKVASQATETITMATGGVNTTSVGVITSALSPAVSSPAEPAKDGERLFATPLARRLARERNIDLALVKGSGPGGRITRDDVEHFKPSGGAPVAVPAVPVTGEVPKQLSRMQQVIARRMVESKTQVPHFYLRMDADVQIFQDLRNALNNGQEKEKQIRFDAMLIRVCALALKKFPEANASYRDGQFIYHENINIGFAVAVPHGLIVPVVRQCDRKGVRQIDEEMRPLIERARAGKSATSDLEESTFSISNLGMYGVEEFDAVVNPPNAAILAVGAVIPTPVVWDQQIVIRPRMKLTLSADHRILYGAPAAQFLQEIKRIIESPYEMLL